MTAWCRAEFFFFFNNWIIETEISKICFLSKNANKQMWGSAMNVPTLSF